LFPRVRQATQSHGVQYAPPKAGTIVSISDLPATAAIRNDHRAGAAEIPPLSRANRRPVFRARLLADEVRNCRRANSEISTFCYKSQIISQIGCNPNAVSGALTDSPVGCVHVKAGVNQSDRAMSNERRLFPGGDIGGRPVAILTAAVVRVLPSR
jgi:hypothetical protein